MEGAPKELFGGVRIAVDGTRFIFLHNTDPDHPVKGKVTLIPGKMSKPGEPIEVRYDLPALDCKVLVVPAGKKPSQGEWWPKEQMCLLRPSRLPDPVRITSVLKKEDDFSQVKWQLLPQLVSLSDLDVNDFRYSLYRTHVNLTSQQAADERFLLFNMFTRDIVSVQVNGKQVKRLFPDKAEAQTWTTRNCFDRIRPDEYDNRFDVSGLLKEGENEIIAVYETLDMPTGMYRWKSWLVSDRVVCPS